MLSRFQWLLACLLDAHLRRLRVANEAPPKLMSPQIGAAIRYAGRIICAHVPGSERLRLKLGTASVIVNSITGVMPDINPIIGCLVSFPVTNPAIHKKEMINGTRKRPLTWNHRGTIGRPPATAPMTRATKKGGRFFVLTKPTVLPKV